MSVDSHGEARLRSARVARVAGVAIVLLSVTALALGLMMIQSLSRDVRASVNVSRSALEAIGLTIEAVDDVAADTTASLSSASSSVEEASAAVDSALGTLDGVATFLDEDLPETLETIRMSMPAAIQTANAVDGTLRTLSFFGVDYDPAEPFGDSLSRVNTALASLPDELRAQSQSLRLLVPSGQALAEETNQLAESMGALEESLEGLTSLSARYETTISEAETTIEATDASIGSNLWMLRALLGAAAVTGVVTGLVLFALGRDMERLHSRLDALTAETVGEVEHAAYL